MATKTTTKALGIDIGGSGIKGAPVDLATGALLADRFRIETPQPSKPKAVAAVVGRIVEHFAWRGRIGCGFPAVVKNGTTLTAANVDSTWIGCDASKLLSDKIGRKVRVANDADVAGLAEMRFGVGRGKRGLVFMATFGTGIGSALFYDGVLIPNSELGHIELRGKDAERRASASVRDDKQMSYKKWGDRVNEYLLRIEALLSPDLIIIGGGVSDDADKFIDRIETRCPTVAAKLHNEAGIVGAALIA